MAKLNLMPHFAIVGFQADFDIRVGEHFCEHRCVPVFREGLEFLVAKWAISIGSERNPPADTAVELNFFENSS